MLRKALFLLVSIVFFSLHSRATHVMGGELSYRYLGAGNYEFTLKLYRNCSPGAYTAPNSARIRIKDSINTIFNPLLPRISVVNITDSTNDDPCLIVPPDVCVEEYTYQDVFNLPNIPEDGLHVTYSLRNRNWSIANVVTPGDINMILYERIPDTSIAIDNNTPVFDNFPPTFICVNEQLNFDHSATDPDGDSLYYELYHPYGAADGNYGNSDNFDPTVTAGTPALPLIPWNAPYGTNDPMGGVPLTIDQNGILKAIPNLVGQYVVGIMVSEYRNGVLIGRHLKDFQFNVTDCERVKARIKTGFGALIGCGNTVTFPNKSLGASDFLWDFGDPLNPNDTSSEISPTYTYSDTGSYEVLLVADPGSVCADSITVNVTLNPPMQPAFSANDVCDGYPVQFSDNTVAGSGSFIVLRQWDFGDGSYSTSANPSHLYADSGVYTIRLIVTSNLGCVDSISKTINVKSAPTAEFYVDTTAGCDPLTINFTDSSKNGDNYRWDLGDGTIWDTMAANFSFVYTYNGGEAYLAQLIVANLSTGCLDTASVLINNYPNPKAEFNTLNPVGCNPLDVDFSNISERASNYHWDFGWDLGNGDTSTDSVPPPVRYTNTGSVDSIYIVTLIVTSSFGCAADTTYDTITVKPVPTAQTLQDDSICEGEVVNITALDEEEGAIYQWIPSDYLDNDTIANPSSKPDTTVSYIVLKMTHFNCVDTTYKTIVVQPSPELSVMNDTSICKGETLQLLTSVDAGAYFWEPEELLEDAFVEDPVTIPLSEKINNFIVTVTGSNGCESVDTIVVEVNFPVVDAGEEKVILRGESVKLLAVSEPGVTYEWEPDKYLNNINIPDPIATPPQTIMYYVQVEKGGCFNTDSVLVRVIDMVLDVPNAFSPDGDGVNDFIYAEGRDVVSFDFRIFDRWGNLVFQTHNLEQGWDGRYNGRLMDMDTYAFYAIAKSELDTKIVKKGNISLLR